LLAPIADIIRTATLMPTTPCAGEAGVPWVACSFQLSFERGSFVPRLAIVITAVGSVESLERTLVSVLEIVRRIARCLSR